MASHKVRLVLIAILTLAALVGVIVLVAMGQTEGTGFGIVTGVLGTLVPALLDAARVETRRRDPRTPAISDDVGSRHDSTPPHSPSDSGR